MSYSSDDDRPLARANGHRLSSSKISRAEDDALDQPVPKQAAKMAGLSVRNGPLEDAMDIDEPATNGASKRKSRTSISKVNYKDDESSDDAAPLVRIHDTGKPFLPSGKRSKPTEFPNPTPTMNPSQGPEEKKLPPSYDETALPESSGDDDEPLSVKLAQKKRDMEKEAEKKKEAEKQAKVIRAKERTKKPATKKAVKDESDDDVPLAKSSASKRRSNGTAAKRKSNGVKKEESDSDAPISKKAKAKPTSSAKKAVKAESKKASESEDEEEYAWWNAPKKENDDIKWTTLEHNGVLFPT
ncbi:hypothetical protein RAB80_004842 [Fusarium oxysporum f. sp. vasinfectum]|nr:hypothetical protein RAB80_004842 [Fusarium oxysporum f. sp. vasinfectum]